MESAELFKIAKNSTLSKKVNIKTVKNTGLLEQFQINFIKLKNTNKDL